MSLIKHKLIFRFDVDTHKCIRNGVPNLINLASKHKVSFSFFLNLGCSISRLESIRTLLNHSNSSAEDIKMMSAMSKLGFVDYLCAAIINPKIKNYRKQIDALIDSSCEVGIHGGRNHAKWHLLASSWNTDKLKKEIRWAVNEIMRFHPDIELKGFASPGWNSPECLPEVLEELGFSYCADYRCLGKNNVLIEKGGFPYVGVNLLGEPGGVAFFENCRVNGYSDFEIQEIIYKAVRDNECTVVYDHPYYAGVRELNLLDTIIDFTRKELDCEITTLDKII